MSVNGGHIVLWLTHAEYLSLEKNASAAHTLMLQTGRMRGESARAFGVFDRTPVCPECGTEGPGLCRCETLEDRERQMCGDDEDRRPAFRGRDFEL